MYQRAVSQHKIRRENVIHHSSLKRTARLTLRGWAFIVFLMLPVFSWAQQQTVDNLRIWHSPDNTRIVFDVSAGVKYKTFLLSNPRRLVVDLNQADLSVSLPKLKQDNRHLLSVRSGRPSKGVLRLVFDLKNQVNINSFVLTPNELYGHRLVIDLTDDGQLAKTGVVSTQVDSNDEASLGDPNLSLPVEQTALPSPREVTLSADNEVIKPFTIAIDAGHGGDDPGAIGHRGTREKKLTLAIAKKLQQRINRNTQMRAVLVRTADYYIKLHDRRSKAKQIDADVFISIHADAFGKKSARGMSVFALSQKGATSAMAQALADKENASDLIGGVTLADKDDVLAKVLVDLSMTNTISESVNLGGRVLAELGKLGHLHSRRVEQAAFAVLKTPDIPSILVETGFITNPEEERRLRSDKYQTSLANAIYSAVNDYYLQTPYASRTRYGSPSIANSSGGKNNTKTVNRSVKYGRHKVVRGDSLSTIAQKYGITLRELKRLNKIKHNTAMLGVRLKVPVSGATSNNVAKSASRKTVTHTVRSGESLSHISAKYNVTIRAIKRDNKLTKNTLYVGQKLRIGGAANNTAAVKKIRTHKVKRGDTLSEIAERYNSNMQKIKKANKLRSNTVQLGQVLIIPI